MAYTFKTEISGFIFEFNEYGPLNREEQDKGELKTTMGLWSPDSLARHDVTRRIGEQIPGIASIEYKHKYLLVIERGNDLFPWEKLIEPLIYFLYQEKHPTVEAVDEIESPPEFMDY